MNAIVLDAATREKLLAAGGVVEFRDAAGNLIGQYVRSGPPTPPAGYVIEGEWPSDEELDRREREGKWYPAANVKAFLKGMKRGWEARRA